MTNLADVRLEDGSVQAIEVPAPGANANNPKNVPYTYGAANVQITGITNPFTPTQTGRLKLDLCYTGTDATPNETIATALYSDPTSDTGAPGGTLLTSGPTLTSADVTGTYVGTFSFAGNFPVGVPVTFGLNQIAAHALTGAPFFIVITESPLS